MTNHQESCPYEKIPHALLNSVLKKLLSPVCDDQISYHLKEYLRLGNKYGDLDKLAKLL